MTAHLPLLCPACGRPDPGGPRPSALLRPGPAGGLECPACGLRREVRDGVPCLPPDPEAFRAAQASWLEPGAPPVDPSEGDACCRRFESLDPASVAFREAALLGQHAAAHHPGDTRGLGLAEDLACNRATVDALRSMLASGPLPSDAPLPAVLEAGCGPGALAAALADLAPAGAVGLDVRIALLRLAARTAAGGRALVGFRVEGTRFRPLEVSPLAARGPLSFVQGDVAAPPFPDGTFAAVAAVSLLDTVPDPLGALARLDALLAPGGLLLLATPWQWEPAVTPPEGWWGGALPGGSGEFLLRTLSGQYPALPRLSYELLDRTDLPWALPGHGRLVHRYRLDAVLARKAR